MSKVLKAAARQTGFASAAIEIETNHGAVHIEAPLDIAFELASRINGYPVLASFVESLLNPEERGHAVPSHVRNGARAALGLEWREPE